MLDFPQSLPLNQQVKLAQHFDEREWKQNTQVGDRFSDERLEAHISTLSSKARLHAQRTFTKLFALLPQADKIRVSIFQQLLPFIVTDNRASCLESLKSSTWSLKRSPIATTPIASSPSDKRATSSTSRDAMSLIHRSSSFTLGLPPRRPLMGDRSLKRTSTSRAKIR